MNQTIVAIQQLQYTINGRAILQDINAEIPSDSFVGVLGENGAGKTTLLDQPF